MPFFPKIFWTIKFYPLIKDSQNNSFELVLRTNGNLIANYSLELPLGSRSYPYNIKQSAWYFCSSDSKSAMCIVDYSKTFSNDVQIICTITIPFDSHIGARSLTDVFQHSRQVVDNQKHCRFTIKVQDRFFNIHKCILSIHYWPHFVPLPNSRMLEAESRTLP